MVADLLAKWVTWFQRGWNRPDFTVANITEWDFHECVDIGFDIYKYINADGVFENLDPIPGAVEALRALHESGKWKIILASAPSRNPNSCAEKHRWREKYLPFLTRKDLWLGHHKWMLRADALLEDSPEQIADYRAMWPDAWIGAIAYEYNRKVESLTNCFAQDYTQFSAAWETLHQALTEL
jgi:5'(3')-deoxyribonucleotidase